MAPLRSRSLLTRTLLAVAAATLLLVAAALALLFQNVRADALATRDAHLEDMAVALARADVANVIPGALTMAPEQFEKRLDSDEPLVVRRRRMMMMPGETVFVNPMKRTEIPAGEPVALRMMTLQGQTVHVAFNSPLRSGLTTRRVDGEELRICVVFLPTGRYTAVAEPLQQRDSSALKTATAAVLPLAALLPVLLGVIAWVIWKTLKPLDAATREVASRRAASLEPLSTAGVPDEIRPFVNAVNALLARVREARTREIRFTADAAHEIRSPLTALTLEAEHLDRITDSPEARPVVRRLREGLERSVKQVSQLLLFARAQSGEAPELLRRDARPWYLSELAGEALEPLLDQIEKKGLRFSAEGLDGKGEQPVSGVSRAPAFAILRNLLENAVHYTPGGGSITLTAKRTDQGLEFTVRDTGPGIPESERERVFDPFYRIKGSGVAGTGLGLAIVKTYADMAGGTVTLSDARPGERPPGLCAAVFLPASKD
ncbi:ATP-binding protein [Mesosutterella sp. OilRF-GAM-744-9]|uniref:histidine kinase n=1 Tax=Mesosutterella porci TaxID=2915351 RepID=A0ABS9MSE1_9BURK|nr:ATP-binding protein [Mesosutterella sp. oilRF-744-WT-GAM-9]MCG5031543.1 ATP-binding protein [Mesosutterella sp. oilRF-744-WT-GAM-9]